MIKSWQQNSQDDWCLTVDHTDAYVIMANNDFGWDVWLCHYHSHGGVLSEVFLCTSGELLTAKFYAEQDYRAARIAEQIHQ